MKTLNDLFDATYRKYSIRPAMGYAFEKSKTYKETNDLIVKVTAFLMNRGITHGTNVAILAENSPYWYVAYLAIIRLGAVAVPILPDFPESDVHHIIKESEVSNVFATSRQIEKLTEINQSLKMICLLDNSQVPLEQSISFDEIIATEVSESDITVIAQMKEEIHSDSLASLIYTSGTSGHSKAVMLSHGNLLSNLQSVHKLISIGPDWTFLSILPMSHAYEFTIGFLLPISRGARIVYSKNRPTPTILGKICQAEKPSVICVVPMIMEKIYKKRVLPKLDSGKIIQFCISIGFIRKIIMKKIGQRLVDFFGGKLQLIAIGGAALHIDAEQFFYESGFPYLVGYGLTETSPLLAGGPFKDSSITVGSCGKPVSGVQLRIDAPDPSSGIGEIVAKGPNIMKGYYKNTELTMETIDQDGWLKTGDLGLIDSLGNLHIKGRNKNVIVLASGENIYPETIEEKINTSKYVVECLVLENDKRLEARIYPDYDLIDQETEGKTNTEIEAYVEKILKGIKNQVNSILPHYSKLFMVKEQTEPFTKTATHKIKRYLYQ